MVPLALSDATGEIWMNPKPGSTRMGRIQALEFKKETEEVILERFKINSSVKQFPINHAGLEYNVKLEKWTTLYDGKDVACLSDGVGVQNCNICFPKRTPKNLNVKPSIVHEMYSLENEQFKRRLEFGIGDLHAGVGMLECLMKGSAKKRAEIRKGRMTKHDHAAFTEEYEYAKDELWEQCGIYRVDLF